jgi:L,D-transpeptidase ErfK/SrfK
MANIWVLKMKQLNSQFFKNFNIIRLIPMFLLLGCSFTNAAFGLTFTIPDNGDIVGAMQTTTVRSGESLGDIGRRFDLGVYEMIEANPTLDPWVPTVGAMVVIPTQFILPQGARTGMVLNLAEMRLYYFHPDKRQVTTHPIGIGQKKSGSPTPLGQSVIINKKKDPPWHPPASIRQEHLEKNDILPAVVAGGIPENPLGRYAFYLSPKGLSSKGSFLVHGTNRPGGIGVRATHGCIRLFPEDIESLFYIVPIGTPVRIIHEPFKVGWHNNRLYLEAHQPLSESQYAGSSSFVRLAKLIEKAISQSHMVNWTSAKMAAKSANGYPVRID